jgi:ketosteroid isomerase-like protein
VASNRATVEELLTLMNTRERTVMHLFHPDVEWRWPESTPGGGVFRGHDGLEEGIETWTEPWEELVLETNELIEDGAWVLAMLTYRARGAGSGVGLEASVAHLPEFEDGLIRRWWMFGNAERARRRFLAGDRPA